MSYKKVEYNGNSYAIMEVRHKNKIKPVVLDWKDYINISELKKTWKCNGNNFIYCSHTVEDINKDIYLHDIIKAIEQKENGEKRKFKPIIHLNNNPLDNRRINLLYDDADKCDNKNSKKKARTIKLPKNSGVKISELPTYVWYLKPNGSHGERFFVEIGDIKWKTTSSKKVSLRYKLEEAKQYLRELKKDHPDIFNERCMNGEYTKKGKKLLKEFHEIIEKNGYRMKKINTNGLTDKYLEPKNLHMNEKKLLTRKLSRKRKSRRRLFNNLPEGCGVHIDDLPKHVYYRPKKDNRGDYFIVENHPKYEGKTWTTTTSKTVSFKEKYNELLKFMEKL